MREVSALIRDLRGPPHTSRVSCACEDAAGRCSLRPGSGSSLGTESAYTLVLGVQPRCCEQAHLLVTSHTCVLFCYRVSRL